MIEVSSSSIACPCDAEKGRRKAKKKPPQPGLRAAATAERRRQEGGAKGDKGCCSCVCVCVCVVCGVCVCLPLCPLTLPALPLPFSPVALLAAAVSSVFPVLVAHRSLTAYTLRHTCRTHSRAPLFAASRVPSCSTTAALCFSLGGCSSPLASSSVQGAHTDSFRHHAA
jgi:hypothetical protein